MALYRRGTASMDADGTVHGTDTKWKDQLALIRVGATIVFLEQPIKLAVISDIVSDTELKAISTDGQTAANGKYVILLNDSLTVNGLAQNVAETLRYYQSKETEIAGAMDIIASLDMDNLNRIVEEIKANKSAAESAQNQAELARDSANAARDEAKATKGQVQQIVDGAVGSINAAKEQAITDVGSKESAAITHIDTEEKAAIKAINDAKGDLSGYVNNAQAAAQTATSAKNDAQAARDAAVSSKDAAAVSAQEAKDAANSVNASNLLTKDGNLSGLTNTQAARNNLQVLYASNSNLGSTDLNTLNSTKEGRYYQTTSANATSERNYPFQEAGCLTVFKTGAGSVEACIQEYTTFSSMRRFVRSLAGTVWKEWKEIYLQGSFPTYSDINAKGRVRSEKEYPSFEWVTTKVGDDFIGKRVSIENGSGVNMFMFFMQKETTANRRVVSFARPNSTVFHFVGYNGGLPTDGNSAPSNNINFNTQPQGWRLVSGGWQNAPLAGNNYGTLFTQCMQGVAHGDSKNTGDSGLWYSQRYTNTESRMFIRNQTNNANWSNWFEFTKTAVSDERLKNVKGNLNVEGALDNINRMEFKVFSFKDDKKGKGYRRGVISQQIRQIDKEYTKEIGGYYHLDQTPMLLDGLAAIKALRARDEESKKRISDLESRIYSLEDMIKKLIENK